MDYLTFLFTEKKLEYRTINVHRSSLSATLPPIDGIVIGQHLIICCLRKGMFNLRPPKKVIFPTWSVQKVLEMLRMWAPASHLDLKCLTLKTVMLTALATAKRPSSMQLFSIKPGFLELGESKIRLQTLGLEKHTRPSFTNKPVVLYSLKEDPRLDPVHYIKAYIKMTVRIRKSDKLFVTINRPHEEASSGTIARWLKQVISQSGQLGKGGSTRSATTSLALNRGATLETIVSAGDWARVDTFKRHY